MASHNRAIGSPSVLSQDLSPENGVKKIINSKVVDDGKGGRVRYYQVEWRSSTWEKEHSLTKCCSHLINNFWEEKLSYEKETGQKEPKHKELLKQPQGVEEKRQLEQNEQEQTEQEEQEPANNPKETDNSSLKGGVRKRKTKKPIKVTKSQPKRRNSARSSTRRLNTESEEEIDQEFFYSSDSSDSSEAICEDPRDNDFMPELNDEKTDDNELTDESEYSPEEGKQNRIVTCVNCGISYNNSFYKKKCRACTNTCKECGKLFKTPSGLRHHMEGVHEKSLKYRCDVCLKAFTTRPSLNKHLRQHKDRKNHTCDVCLKTYSDVTKLRRHKLIHTGIKEFKCNVCHREFQQNEALQKHMLLHTDGPRRFQCSLCKKGFNHKVSLKSHMLKNHDKNEQQAAVMIGLWNQYQQNEACSENFVNDQNDVLSKALNDVVMKPQDGGQNLPLENHLNDIPLLNFETALNLP